MNLPRGMRMLVALGIVVLALAGLLLVLVVSEAALTIQARLSELPAWIKWGWWGLLGLGSVVVGVIVWRLLLPQRDDEKTSAQDQAPLDEAEIERRIAQAEAVGADTAEVRAELAKLQERRAAGEIHVVLFGEISTGKSALIRALLPGAEARSDVKGGTTRELHRFSWQSPAGDTLVLTDMPGTAEAEDDGTLDEVARDEALRAHAVVYVCDGDLTRRQFQELGELLDLDKPSVVALTKSDRYASDELAMVKNRLVERVGDRPSASVVTVSGGGKRAAVRVFPDGSEEMVERDVPPNVDELSKALQRIIDGDTTALEKLRDSSVFVLVSQHLDEATAEARREKAGEMVESYTKKAVAGALAAITPGTDLLIQGWLGTQMVKELAALYGIQVRKIDVELLLQLVQQHVGKTTTLLLAVAGNAFKAFPGVGTLAGGAMHAVAYGLIFRTLGRSLVTTLHTRGELHPLQTAAVFKETLGDNMEASARGLAKLALAQGRSTKNKD